MGTYAELRKPEWLSAQMTLKDLDCADVARQINAEFGTSTRPQIVSRQFISRLKTGRTRRCTPVLAERICWAVGSTLDQLFVVHEVRKISARSAQDKREKVPA